jgi:hypothetical protein
MSQALQVIDTEFTDNPSTALTRRSMALAPVQSIEDAVALRAQIVEFTRRIMVAEKDYGVIPGTGSKPTLLKPGAEKLCTHFGLFDSFEIIEKVEDWTGVQHGGEPFFAYTVKCSLTRNGEVISEGVGHCNSWEKKYRFRRVFGNKATEDDKRRGKPIAGKYGTDYLITNDDIFDQVNTLLKMAKKRGLIDATLRAVSASEFYTQDVEDTHSEAEAQQEEVAPKLSQKVIADKFAAVAKTCGFDFEGNSELRHLCRTLLGEEPADVWAYQKALDLTEQQWKAAVQQANQDIADTKPQTADNQPAVSDTLIEVPPTPVEAQGKTLEAMAK